MFESQALTLEKTAKSRCSIPILDNYNNSVQLTTRISYRLVDQLSSAQFLAVSALSTGRKHQRPLQGCIQYISAFRQDIALANLKRGYRSYVCKFVRDHDFDTSFADKWLARVIGVYPRFSARHWWRQSYIMTLWPKIVLFRIRREQFGWGHQSCLGFKETVVQPSLPES